MKELTKHNRPENWNQSGKNAQKAVQVTLGFLKTKLPTPVAAQFGFHSLLRIPVAVDFKSLSLNRKNIGPDPQNVGRVG